MAVPRAKKNKKTKIPNVGRKKTKQDLMIGIQELTKSVIYLYLADVKKFSYDEILKLNKFFARQTRNIARTKEDGGITFDDILDNLYSKGIDMKKLGRETDEWLDKYWEV